MDLRWLRGPYAFPAGTPCGTAWEPYYQPDKVVLGSARLRGSLPVVATETFSWLPFDEKLKRFFSITQWLPVVAQREGVRNQRILESLRVVLSFTGRFFEKSTAHGIKTLHVLELPASTFLGTQWLLIIADRTTAGMARNFENPTVAIGGRDRYFEKPNAHFLKTLHLGGKVAVDFSKTQGLLADALHETTDMAPVIEKSALASASTDWFFLKSKRALPHNLSPRRDDDVDF